MLIVGGTAALTAIVVYLAWHFLRRWRASWREPTPGHRPAIGDRTMTEQQAQDARELHPVP
jgi:hypothetical protein